jgi:hypothetical protein
VTAPPYPVCGRPLAIPTTGRRPVYCGKACWQAPYRARLAAGRATWARRELSAAGDRGQAEGLAHEFGQPNRELVSALARLRDLPPRGWEEHVTAAAREVARLAHWAGDLARTHARAAADYQTAQQVLRRGGLTGPDGDETPSTLPGSVSAQAARDRATKARHAA